MKDKWIKRQLEILAAAKAEGRGLTAAEQAEFDECQRQIEAEEAPPAGGGAPDGGERGAGGGIVSNLDTNSGAPAPEDGARRAMEAERQRIGDILALCRQTGMDAEAYIQNGDSLDAVRSAAVEHLLRHGAPVVVGARDSGTDNFRDAARDALLMQAGVEVENPAQGAEDYRGMSLRDILIESMARSGAGTATELLRRSRNNLWDSAARDFLSPTADFPAILDNAVNKAIVQQYQLVPATFELWTGKGSLPDFKLTKNHEYALGGGDFYKVSEGGELKHSTLQTEMLPNRKLETYGTQFTMTREAFINSGMIFGAVRTTCAASWRKSSIKKFPPTTRAGSPCNSPSFWPCARIRGKSLTDPVVPPCRGVSRRLSMRENVIEIDIESEIQKIVRQLDSLPEQIAAPRILQQALNAAGRKVRKQIVRNVQGEYAIKERKVLRDKEEGAPQVLAASTSNLTAIIRSRGPMQDIMTFMTRPNTETGAAAAKVLSSSSFKPLEVNGLKAFVARFESKHVAIIQRDPPQKYSESKFIEKRNKKYGPKPDMTKIKKLLSPSVPHMLNNEAVRGPAEDMTYELLQAEIRRRIEKIKLG